MADHINSPIAPVPTAPIARTKTREFVMKSQQAMIDTYSWECCANCDHWAEQHIVKTPDSTKYSGFSEVDEGPRCMKYEARPPTKIILIGCDSYTPDIPF
jgi:hypothetical protein